RSAGSRAIRADFTPQIPGGPELPTTTATFTPTTSINGQDFTIAWGWEEPDFDNSVRAVRRALVGSSVVFPLGDDLFHSRPYPLLPDNNVPDPSLSSSFNVRNGWDKV